MLNLSLGVLGSTYNTATDSKDLLESEYQSFYKPILRFLRANAAARIFFSFTGPQLDYYKHHHSEFFSILKDLYALDQTEVLGAGFFNPIFPLLFPRERTAQLELFTTFMRDNLGKKPHGVAPAISAWDFSLLNTFSSASFDYVLLESEAISPYIAKNTTPPYLMSDKAKSVTILPYTLEHSINKSESAREWLDTLLSEVPQNSDSSRIFFFTPSDFAALIDSGFLGEVFNLCCNNPFMENISRDKIITITTPYNFLENTKARSPIYIPSCIKKSLVNTSTTIFDYLREKPQSKALNDRVIYETLLLNQNRLDKMTKDNARKFILSAQNCAAYTGDTAARLYSYKMLSQSEKVLRTCDTFKASVTKFDYNGDAIFEYIAREKNYFCIINNLGAVVELEYIKKPTTNFTDGGKIFCESLNDTKITTYKEEKFSFSYTKEVFFKAEIKTNIATFIVKKKVVISESSLTVQYIIKNDSDKDASVTFNVENALTPCTPFSTEVVIRQNNVVKVNSDALSYNTGATALQLMDESSALSLIFEPNEPCNIKNLGGNHFALSWDLTLAPNGETEKTINFYILSMKKR